MVSTFSTIVFLQLIICVLMPRTMYKLHVLQVNTIVSSGKRVLREKDNRKLFVCLPFSMLLFRLPFFSSEIGFQGQKNPSQGKFLSQKKLLKVSLVFSERNTGILTYAPNDRKFR